MRRSLALTIGAMLLAGALAAPAVAAPSTAVNTFVPQIPGGKVRSGNCWTGSIADPRPGAYRCMLGNEIMDPCFRSPRANVVVCGADPVIPQAGFAVSVTKPLPPTSAPPGPVRPWIVVFASGIACRPFTGTMLGYKDTSVSYACPPSPTGFMLGLLDTIKPGTTWTAQQILYTPSDRGQAKAKSVTTVPVATIWR